MHVATKLVAKIFYKLLSVSFGTACCNVDGCYSCQQGSKDYGYSDVECTTNGNWRYYVQVLYMDVVANTTLLHSAP